MLNQILLRRKICEIGRLMYARRFVAANDGNISVLLKGGNILTTPTGVSKGSMKPKDLVVTDSTGRAVGQGKPSSELLMHLFIYNERADVKAVVHAHPIYSTGYAVTGIALDQYIVPEIITTLGSIPLAAYGTPSTRELAETLRPHIKKADGILLANHGVVTVGRDLKDAYFKMERIEHYAQIMFVAKELGGAKKLPPEEVEKLHALCKNYGSL